MSEPITETRAASLVWDGDRAPLAKALVAAQKATESIKKAATNPAFKSKYADLAHVVEGVVPALNAAGVMVLQNPGFDGDMVSVTTTFLHESGASVTGNHHVRPSKTDAQGVGSAITYARRYALLAMAGGAPEDDDGNAASGPSQRPANGTGQRITPEPEGADWWGADGPGPSAYSAKKAGGEMKYEDMRTAIGALSSGAEWRAWCAENNETIRALPKSWRIILREEAEHMATELGVDLNQRRAA